MSGATSTSFTKGDSRDADRDRSAARHAGFEDMLGRVHLPNGDERHRVPGEHCGVGLVSIQKSSGVDAESDPAGEGGEEQISGLGEEAGDRKRRHDTDHRGDQPIAGLVQSLAAGRRREDRDRQGRSGGRLQLEPEARRQCGDDGNPDAYAKRPGAQRSAGEAQRTRDRRGRHGIVSRAGDGAAPAKAAALAVDMRMVRAAPLATALMDRTPDVVGS